MDRLRSIGKYVIYFGWLVVGVGSYGMVGGIDVGSYGIHDYANLPVGGDMGAFLLQILGLLLLFLGACLLYYRREIRYITLIIAALFVWAFIGWVRVIFG